MIRVSTIKKLCALTGAASFEEVGKTTESGAASFYTNFCRPLITGLVPTDACYPRGVGGVLAHVEVIVSERCMTKVDPAVIVSDMVYVVNLVWRKLSLHVKEGKTMSQKAFTGRNANSDVSVSALFNSGLSCSSAIASNKMGKRPSLWAIVNTGFQVYLSQFHEALQSFVGLGGWGLSPSVPAL